MLSGCAGKQDHAVSPAPPQVAENRADGMTVFNYDGQTRLTQEQFAAVLCKADYVLVGERHDSGEQHKAQLFVLETLEKNCLPSKTGSRIALGLEMLPFTEQAHLDALQRGSRKKPASLEEFAKRTDWKRNWGYDRQLYAAPLEFALQHKIPIVGLNVSQAMVKAVRQHEIAKLNQLSKKEKKALGLPDNLQLPELIPPTESQRPRLRMIFNMHMDRMAGKAAAAGNAPAEAPGNAPGMSHPSQTENMAASGFNPEIEARFARFMRTQSLWDTVMAWQAVKARAKIQGPLVILAGAEHVEYGWGIASRLHIFDPEAKIVLVLPTQQVVSNGTQTVPLVQEPVSDRQAADYYLLCKADPPNLDEAAARPEGRSRPENKGRLGLRLRMPEETEAAAGSKFMGLEVLEVMPGSRAEAAGIQPGDVVTGAGNKPVNTIMDLHQAGKTAAEAGHGLKLQLKRGNEKINVNIPAAK